MRTRFRLGISAVALALALPFAAHAQGAVTVIGGGLAKDCYDAVEFNKVQLTRAIEICDLALETEHLRPKDRAATFTNRGILYMRQGNNSRAMMDYQRSINLLPDLREAKVNLGAALYNLQRYPEAMAALNEGVATESLEARAVGFYNRALTHEKLGDLQAAYEDFRSALQIKPEFPQATAQLARFTVVPVDS
ncbi:MAG: tetratricopeptide repeat protein [Hyphomonadaceae bacterium]|nr:tetratricopeptide repeat protein [Hyphomonadaceae bacterium]